MAKYFNFFPKTLYSLSNKSTSADFITNIIARFGFEKELKENSNIYYPYDIQDGDTPETIANKYYGSPERHWVVLLFNDIIDPQYDWPLDQRTIVKFINDKYTANGVSNTTPQTGLAWSQSNTKSYYKVVTRVTNNATKNTIKEKIELDANTYANVVISNSTRTLQSGTVIVETVSKETESYYDYEVNLNESKRRIRLLRSEIVSQSGLLDEFKRVINSKE
jgi:hypothetical protein